MWGALATSVPSPSNTAQEKSRRSRTLTDRAVRWSTAPPASATAMNRAPHNATPPGVRSVGRGWATGTDRSSRRSNPSSRRPIHPSGTNTLVVGKCSTRPPSTDGQSGSGGRSGSGPRIRT